MLDVLGTRLRVIDVPGHTAGHIAYFAPDETPPLLFCGDTLFACGCGRLFEGTPARCWRRSTRWPRFRPPPACTAPTNTPCRTSVSRCRSSPSNVALLERAARDRATRERGEPTLPSTIGLELATNPFLRCDAPSVRAAVAGSATAESVDRTSIFASLRQMKNNFR